MKKKKSLLDGILDLLFPPRCPFCTRLLRDKQEEEEGWCASCGNALSKVENKGNRKKVDFCDRCLSPLWYRDRVVEAIHRFKFSGHSQHALIFGRLMADCIKEEQEMAWDFITFVPLSRKRFRCRGYNQSELLARQVGIRLGAPVENTLKKVHDTKTQSRLTDEGARRANVLGAYQVTDEAKVRGKRILLIDDVVTTGSTLSECARVLRIAGALSVTALTLARARK